MIQSPIKDTLHINYILILLRKIRTGFQVHILFSVYMTSQMITIYKYCLASAVLRVITYLSLSACTVISEVYLLKNMELSL